MKIEYRILALSFFVIIPILFLSARENEKKANSSIKWVSKEQTKNGFVLLFNGKNFDDWVLLLRDGSEEEAKKVYTITDDGGLHFFKDLPAGSGNGPERRNAFHGVMATKKS